LRAVLFPASWEALGRPAEFVIVEQGAHHGDFARDVLTAARERRPDFFSALRYRIVEPFPILQQRQKETLGDFQKKLTWAKSLDDLEPFCGVHFSNELLDAMPVHLITHEESTGEWLERSVAESGDGFAFVTKPIVDGALLKHLARIPRPLAAPYETEVNLAASEWIDEVSRKLERGFILAVDYGYPRDQFYAPQRTKGTLQCYAGHRTISSPLEDIGHADMSAHLDWTSIAERAEECGLTLTGFTDQHHFITGLLSLRTPEESERRALQTLLHPEFLGTRFQYLALGKNAPQDQLSGFRFARDPRRTLGLG
jgi:SAM-dependent MidA family methyltransferase